MKKIIILVCACLTLLGCQTTAQKSPEALAIESVYKIDQSIVANSKTIAEVVAKAESISLAGCPQDFVKAYKANIDAWRKMADIERQMYASGNIAKASADISRFLYDYQTNPSQAGVRLKKDWPALSNEIDTALADITKTFTDYTSIGTEYNVVYYRQKNFF